MRDPKTTITGVLLGGALAVQPIVENGDFEIKRDWLKIVLSVGVFVLGLLAKDPNKKGI